MGNSAKRCLAMLAFVSWYNHAGMAVGAGRDEMPAPASSPSVALPATPAALIEAYFDALNTRDFDRLEQLHSTDTIKLKLFDQTGLTEPDGVELPESFKERQRLRLRALPTGLRLSYRITHDEPYKKGEADWRVVCLDQIPSNTVLGDAKCFALHRTPSGWIIDETRMYYAGQKWKAQLGPFFNRTDPGPNPDSSPPPTSSSPNK